MYKYATLEQWLEASERISRLNEKIDSLYDYLKLEYIPEETKRNIIRKKK